MASNPHPHTVHPAHGTVFHLIECLAFPWVAAERTGAPGWTAGNTAAERSFWKQANGSWLVVWRDGDQPARTMALDGTLTPNEVASKIARWHLNRSAMLRNEGNPVPGSARAGVNLLMECHPGALAQRCSAILRRPVPLHWTLADAIDAFPTERTM
jgi:hypothetical protein